MSELTISSDESPAGASYRLAWNGGYATLLLRRKGIPRMVVWAHLDRQTGVYDPWYRIRFDAAKGLLWQVAVQGHLRGGEPRILGSTSHFPPEGLGIGRPTHRHTSQPAATCGQGSNHWPLQPIRGMGRGRLDSHLTQPSRRRSRRADRALHRFEAGELHITNDLYERIVDLGGWPMGSS